MITHDYSEWHEPEKPPFTIEDLVNAVKELMMQYHVTFDEALRHLQEKGIPYNQFLKTSGLEDLIKGYLDETGEAKKGDPRGLPPRQALERVGTGNPPQKYGAGTVGRQAEGQGPLPQAGGGPSNPQPLRPLHPRLAAFPLAERHRR